jgi:hypothetical protein
MTPQHVIAQIGQNLPQVPLGLDGPELAARMAWW